ncbi:MAG: hypothetical protein KKB20_30450 [Proteobacteria bacterium]|nr:hypothetical protein [Pseudomonadota bacterium]
MGIKIRSAELFLSIFIAVSILIGLSWSYAAELVVTPDKTVLSPMLLKQPLMLSGSGWKPNEMVIVNLIPPQGVNIKGVDQGEDVGIALGNANAEGLFKVPIGAMPILMTFFQVDWDSATMKPNFKKATPLPPGAYDLEAVGFESNIKAKTTLTLVPPPDKK